MKNLPWTESQNYKLEKVVETYCNLALRWSRKSSYFAIKYDVSLIALSLTFAHRVALKTISDDRFGSFLAVITMDFPWNNILRRGEDLSSRDIHLQNLNCPLEWVRIAKKIYQLRKRLIWTSKGGMTFVISMYLTGIAR